MGQTEQNLMKHIAFADIAARQGAKIVVFPEVRQSHSNAWFSLVEERATIC